MQEIVYPVVGRIIGGDVARSASGAGPAPDEIYGLAWDETTDTYTRLGALAAYPIGQSPGDLALPIHRQVKRCVCDDAGVVQYFLDGTDSNKKEDGTAAVLDGTDGQVCLYIPKFYSRYKYGSGIHAWELAERGGNGFEVDPAFVKNGVEVPYRLYGCYEGYIDGGGKLCSISGVLPTVNKSRPQFRAAAQLRGAGWHLEDAHLRTLMDKLRIVEYGDFNSQLMVGDGITGYAVWPGGPQALTGNSNGIGNVSGGLSASVPRWTASASKTAGDEVIPNATQNGYTYRCAADGDTGASEPTWPTSIGATVVDGTLTWECVRTLQYVSYRGIENPWGHLWQWVEINIHNSSAERSRVYVCGNPSVFADDTDVGYDMIGLAAESDGYGLTPMRTGRLFYPMTVGGSTVAGLCDYHYTYFDNSPDVGWRAVRVGGVASGGGWAGASCWSSHYAASYASSLVGARVCF